MCDLTDGLTLCTCAGEELAEPDWILERRDESLPVNHRRGRAMRPRFDADEKAWLAQVVALLDVGECFGFPYDRREGDVLHLRGDRRTYRFRVVADRWTVDRSTALDGWRDQMVEEVRGKRG